VHGKRCAVPRGCARRHARDSHSPSPCSQRWEPGASCLSPPTSARRGSCLTLTLTLSTMRSRVTLLDSRCVQSARVGHLGAQTPTRAPAGPTPTPERAAQPLHTLGPAGERGQVRSDAASRTVPVPRPSSSPHALGSHVPLRLRLPSIRLRRLQSEWHVRSNLYRAPCQSHPSSCLLPRVSRVCRRRVQWARYRCAVPRSPAGHTAHP
jgi:hypothetical protein